MDTGSVHYYPHLDMRKTLEKLGEEQRDEIGWLINQRAIQSLIDEGMPFEYTLNGIKPKDVKAELKTIDKIWSGATELDIMKELGVDYVTGRMKELKELYDAGYQLTFDEANNLYLLIKP